MATWVKSKFPQQFPKLRRFTMTGATSSNIEPRRGFVEEIFTYWVGECPGVRGYYNENGRSCLSTVFKSFPNLIDLEIGELSWHSFTPDASGLSNCIWEYGGKLKSLHCSVDLNLDCYRDNFLFLDSIITGFPLQTLNQLESDSSIDEKARVHPSILNLPGNLHLIKLRACGIWVIHNCKFSP